MSETEPPHEVTCLKLPTKQSVEGKEKHTKFLRINIWIWCRNVIWYWTLKTPMEDKLTVYERSNTN